MSLWDYSISYRLARKYVDACVRSCFSRIKVSGRNNIPRDSSVLFAVNHTNTLMDALAVLQDNKGPISFGARADIFRNPRTAKILTWLKIVPIARQRDGGNPLTRNTESFSRIVDCIGHNVPFTIFPEGTHRPKHSLQPLKKGVFRVALQTIRELGGKKVYVVPVGLDYEDFFNPSTSLSIRYGEPICVNDMLERYPDENEAMHNMTELLYKKISSLIRFVPDNIDYEENWMNYLKERPTRRMSLPLRCILSILMIPVFALSAVLSSIIVIPSEIIINKLKDKAWSNTVRFGVKFVLLPFLTILVAILSFLLLPCPWAIALTLFTTISQPVFYWILNLYKSVLK